MPFKSQAQRKFMFATIPKTAEKWAQHTKNIKSLPQHVKKESMQENTPASMVEFWTVKKPESYEQNVKDIAVPCNPFQFSDMSKAGLEPAHVHGFYHDEEEAIKEAVKLLESLYESAKALEEKKGQVADKLQKSIDALQKKAEEHLKMAKSDPAHAEQHHAEAEKAMQRIKDLRGKHKQVEESKKELTEMDYSGKTKK